MFLPLTIIILTYNEEINIVQCIKNVVGWASQIIVVDSFSSDSTVELVRSFGAEVYYHKFENYSDQRKWIMDHVKFENEWIFFLDADEIISEELKREITQKLPLLTTDAAGIEFKRRFYWEGKWVRWGGLYPLWFLRMARHSRAWWDTRTVNEHMHVEGQVIKFEHDIIHNDHKGIKFWIEKHKRYAALEAEEFYKSRHQRKEDKTTVIKGSLSQEERLLREKIWNAFPLLFRPFLYFFYRYIFRLGFLDGRSGFVYHFLHGFWYRLLIDVRYLELLRKEKVPQNQ